eukprot:4386259-Amphidinium_carterae.1
MIYVGTGNAAFAALCLERAAGYTSVSQQVAACDSQTRLSPSENLRVLDFSKHRAQIPKFREAVVCYDV